MRTDKIREVAEIFKDCSILANNQLTQHYDGNKNSDLSEIMFKTHYFCMNNNLSCIIITKLNRTKN